MILVVATVASRGPQRSETPGGTSSASTGVAVGPKVLPSECAVDWKLSLSGRQFSVTGTNPACPPLPTAQLLFVDAARGNGAIHEGDATVWPLSPVGGTGATASAPFTFTVDNWPGKAAGHYYEVWYVPPGTPMPNPGDDATTVYDVSYTVSYRYM